MVLVMRAYCGGVQGGLEVSKFMCAVWNYRKRLCVTIVVNGGVKSQVVAGSYNNHERMNEEIWE